MRTSGPTDRQLRIARANLVRQLNMQDDHVLRGGHRYIYLSVLLEALDEAIRTREERPQHG